jgi:hypothetical protein
LLRYWGKQRAYWGKCPSSYIVKKCPVHQLQIVYNCQEKSQKQGNITGDEKYIFFEIYMSFLLVVACFVVLSIPVFVYIGLRITSKEGTFTLNNAEL